jgi:hypothetical protein
VTSIYVVIGALLAVLLAAAVVRDVLDRKSRHGPGRLGRYRDRLGNYDPTEARLGGPHVNLNPNVPHSDRED